MKKLLTLTMTMGMLLTLAACGGQEGTPDDSAASQVSVCAHEWQEATYEQPKTCTICGETEGEQLADFFTAAGATVQQTLPRTKQPLQYITYLSDRPKTQVAHKEGSFTLTSEASPAEGGGTLIKVTVTREMPVFSDESTEGDFDIAAQEAFFDLYSGEVIVAEHELLSITEQADGLGRILKSDGKEYEIRVSFTEEWDNSGWYVNAEGADEDDYTCVRTYEFVVPEGYQGLVYAALPISEYVPAEVQLNGNTALELFSEAAVKEASLIRITQ